jgi:hypothetical protein
VLLAPLVTCSLLCASLSEQVRFEKTGLPAKVLRKLPGWWSHVGSHTPLEDDQVCEQGSRFSS